MIRNNPLWDYSLKVYQLEGVEPLLLMLQDRFNADINLILAACWLASERKKLTVEMAVQAVEATSAWRKSCVEPLREVRRYLKKDPDHSDLRDRVKALELEAEKVQQRMLYDLLCNVNGVQARCEPDRLSLDNLNAYCETIPAPAWCDLADPAAELVKRLT